MNILEEEYYRTVGRFNNMTSKKDSDEWGTPPELFRFICKMTGTLPLLDVACTSNNCITNRMLPGDALLYEWQTGDHCDVWCNAPGTKISKFVKRAVDQWIRHNINIVMLIPVNTISNKSFQIVWDFMKADKIDIFPLFGIRPHFLWNNQESDYGSRNGYIVVHFKKW